MTGAVDRHRLRFGVAHDFRRPPGTDFTLQDVYAETLEQVALLDRLGLDLVWFSEHHFVEDGYLPSFAPVAGAVAALTSRMRISTDVCLMPFQHPIRLAEDMAVLDQVSGGRMELGLGLGYAPHEFRAFGIPRPQRVSLTEEGVEILRLAWSGETFTYSGRRYSFENVRVTPEPVQEGGPPLWLASTSPASARRAARYATNVLPQGSRAVALEGWRDAVAAEGRDPGTHRTGIIRSVLVTDDPERDWPPLRRAERYRMAIYGRFFEEAAAAGDTPAASDDRIPQRIIVGDVATCASELTAFIRDYGITDVVSWGSAPGLRPSVLSPSMERFARDVVPLVRTAIEGE